MPNSRNRPMKNKCTFRLYFQGIEIPENLKFSVSNTISLQRDLDPNHHPGKKYYKIKRKIHPSHDIWSDLGYSDLCSGENV